MNLPKTSNVTPIPTSLQKTKVAVMRQKARTPVEFIIETMNDKQWADFKLQVNQDNPNLEVLRVLLNDISKENDVRSTFKRTKGEPIVVTPSALEDWYRDYSRGDKAKSLHDDLGAYKHVHGLGVLEKMVCDSVVDAEHISKKVFSADSKLSDKDLLKALPQMRNTAIRGVQALQAINTAAQLNQSKVDGALILGRRLNQIFSGTQMESVIRDTITQCIIDIETYQV